MIPDIDKVTDLVREIAADVILPRFQALEEEERWEKRPGSWVTVADTEAERLFEKALPDIVPGSTVIGEEKAEELPEVFKALRDPDPVWLVDPVDGTQNFASGRPEFGVMVAYVVADEIWAGWIHRPVTGETFVASAGEGSWNGSARLRVAAARAPKEMSGFMGPRFRKDKALAAQVGKILAPGSCAIDYMNLVAGRTHFAYYRSIKPWDHTAGVLIHREAGGHNGRLDGSAYVPDSPDRLGLLMTPDRASWDQLAQIFPDFATPPPT